MANARYDVIKQRASLAGLAAYAQNAAGQKELAKAQLESARRDIDLAMAPPPAPPSGEELRKSVAQDFEARKIFGAQARNELNSWAGLIALRDRAASLTPAALLAEINKAGPTGGVVAGDLLRQLSNLSPSDIKGREQVLDQFGQALKTRWLNENKTDLTSIMELLPRPETESNQAHFHKSGDGYFLSDNGFAMSQIDGEDRWQVSFTSALSTTASIEELLMLTAARLARDKGFDGILLQSRYVFVRTMHVTQYGIYAGGSFDQNSGREAQITLRLVHRDKLPTELVPARWRVLDVNRLITEISAAHPEVQPH